MEFNFKLISEEIELIGDCFSVYDRKDIKENLYNLIILSCIEYENNEKFKQEVEEFANYLVLKDKHKDKLNVCRRRM